MRHRERNTSFADCKGIVFEEEDAQYVLIQPADSHDISERETEVEYIEEHCSRRFLLVVLNIRKWNEQLTPWPAPPVFGKIPFGEGAPETLHLILCNVVPAIRKRYSLPGTTPFILGGYSLAGFFAMWAASKTDTFQGIVAASPSLWYPRWLETAAHSEFLAPNIYLSIGDQEQHSKSKIMTQSRACIEQQKKILDTKRINNILEINPGNHFLENGIRTGKGFAWVMNEITNNNNL